MLPLHHKGVRGPSGVDGVASYKLGIRISEFGTWDSSAFRVPRSAFESTQRESNPHVRHGEAAGSRYIMGAFPDQQGR